MAESFLDKVKETVDKVGGVGTSDKIEGKLHEGVGKVQEEAGQATGDPQLEAKGNLNQARGQVQVKTGEGKEAVSDFVEHAKESIHDGAEKAKDAAANAVNSIKAKFAHKDETEK